MKSDRVYGWVMFVVLSSLVLFRLFVWKFFPTVESFVKEDLTNLLCAAPILVVAGIFYGCKAVLGQPLQQRRTGLEWPLWAYFAASACSLFWSVDRAATLRYAVVLFSYVMFFFMLAETLDDHSRRRAFLFFLLGMALLIAGWGIRDYIYLIQRAPDPSDNALSNTNDSLLYILMNKRACSFFGWPNVLAGFLGLTIPLGFAAVLTWRTIWAKLAAGLCVLTMLAALLVTFSFLGWLSFLIGFIGAMGVFFFRRGALGRGIKIAVILFAIAATALFAIVVVKKDFSISVGPRQQYFTQAVQAIKQHPVLGTGLDTFRYASSKEATDKGGLTAFAHNSYLQCWVEAGIFGFLSMLVLVFFILKKFYGLVWRSKDGASDRLWYMAFVWMFTAVSVDNMWSFTIIKPNISLFFWVALSYACSCDSKAVIRREIKWPVRAVAGWLAVAMIAVAFFFTGRGIATQWMCKNAFAFEMKGQLNEAVQFFKQARQIDPYDARIAFEMGKRYVQGYQQASDQRFLALAEQELLSAADNSPFYGSRLLLGLIYRAQGRNAQARDWINEANNASPFETRRDLTGLGLIREALPQ